MSYALWAAAMVFGRNDDFERIDHGGKNGENAYLYSIQSSPEHIETSLPRIADLAAEKALENDHFRSFLKAQNTDWVDKEVLLLSDHVTPLVDCTQCGNCCKSLMIVVSDDEADALSEHLGQPRASFDGAYLEKGSNGMMVISSMPCHFLSDNRCTVYTHRFAGCREFPALHVPGFNKRLFTTFMHYDRCPIIFNVVEALKTRSGFMGAVQTQR